MSLQHDEKVFNFQIDRISTMCNKLNFVEDFLNIGSKQESDDPLRFFEH